MIRALLGLLALIAAPASAEPAPPALAAELRANTPALLDAVAPGDRGPWERLPDPAFHFDENGTMRTKAELLAELSPMRS